jgi:hypothetical protein
LSGLHRFEEIAMNHQQHELQIGTATSAVLVSLLQTLVSSGLASSTAGRRSRWGHVEGLLIAFRFFASALQRMMRF